MTGWWRCAAHHASGRSSTAAPATTRCAREGDLTEPRGATPTIRITGAPLTFADVVAVARGGAPVELAPEAASAMRRSRAQVDALAAGDRPVYGISTGLGALAGTRIPSERRSELQHALVRSHAAGMGEPAEAEIVRGMMLLRLRTLATGRCGARPAVAEALA